MTNRNYAVLGSLSGITFWVTYLIMSSIRTEYTHFHKAVSELGSVDASNAIIWNLIGFILVGIFICVFAIGLHKSISNGTNGRVAFYPLFACGIFYACAGLFPADMENRTSLITILHLIGSMGSGLFFVVAVFAYISPMRASHYWKSAVIPSLILVLLFIASGFLRSGETPALGQKIGFFFFFLWLGFMAFKLYSHTAAEQSEPATSS